MCLSRKFYVLSSTRSCKTNVCNSHSLSTSLVAHVLSASDITKALVKSYRGWNCIGSQCTFFFTVRLPCPKEQRGSRRLYFVSFRQSKVKLKRPRRKRIFSRGALNWFQLASSRSRARARFRPVTSYRGNPSEARYPVLPRDVMECRLRSQTSQNKLPRRRCKSSCWSPPDTCGAAAPLSVSIWSSRRSLAPESLPSRNGARRLWAIRRGQSFIRIRRVV